MGWGVREFTLIGMLTGTNYATHTEIGAVSIASGLIILIASVPGGLVLLLQKKPHLER